jgi:hypothetical protein
MMARSLAHRLPQDFLRLLYRAAVLGGAGAQAAALDALRDFGS